MALENFAKHIKRPLRIAVVGASGGIGSAMVGMLAKSPGVGVIHALARANNRTKLTGTRIKFLPLDLLDEASIKSAASVIGGEGELDVIIVTSGILHGEGVQPEKDWKQLDPLAMAHIFAVNTIGPALVMKHFAPLLSRNGPSVIAALSARVGSISDNRLGGWYSYRASKAALNQIIRTISIELARKRKDAIVLGLHPGTVATGLSEPFQSATQERLTPEQSAEFLLSVIDNANTLMTGKVYDWKGEVVPE